MLNTQGVTDRSTFLLPYHYPGLHPRVHRHDPPESRKRALVGRRGTILACSPEVQIAGAPWVGRRYPKAPSPAIDHRFSLDQQDLNCASACPPPVLLERSRTGWTRKIHCSFLFLILIEHSNVVKFDESTKRRGELMIVVILNWKNGENDPFTPFNQVLANYLEASGKCTKTVQLTDADWPDQILKLKEVGIDFVFTWQGLGTRFVVGAQNQNIWDIAQVPLITVHGDHPSHMPANHSYESRHCAHLYGTSEFSDYANRYFRKKSRAITINNSPLFSLDTVLDEQGPECFVLPKNVTPPVTIENKWKTALDKRGFDFYMSAAETLKFMLAHEDHLRIHPILDAFLLSRHFEEYFVQNNPAAFHAFHSELDFYLRNIKSVGILEALKDVPLQIIGRGWEPYASVGNPNHHFLRAGNLIDNQKQYYSKFGIIDVTPSATGLHDRTARAMRNETPFLSSGYLPEFLPNMNRYDHLFYRFNGNDLREKCESVMSDPQAHAELAVEFSYLYQMQNQPSEFVWKLDSIARSLDAN